MATARSRLEMKLSPHWFRKPSVAVRREPMGPFPSRDASSGFPECSGASKEAGPGNCLRLRPRPRPRSRSGLARSSSAPGPGAGAAGNGPWWMGLSPGGPGRQVGKGDSARRRRRSSIWPSEWRVGGWQVRAELRPFAPCGCLTLAFSGVASGVRFLRSVSPPCSVEPPGV